MMSQNSLLYKNLTALLRTFLLDFFSGRELPLSPHPQFCPEIPS